MGNIRGRIESCKNINELIGIIKGINFDGVINDKGKCCAFNPGLRKIEILHMINNKWN